MVNSRERSALKAERDLAGIKPLFEQKAASQHVLYEENVLGGTKSVREGIWFRLKRLFGTKWTS